ncbi:MAG: type II toxin-antitoxin system Phd/YefM family antitoxin [Candidatus Hydrogenedentes bacterium]|nr:type II toxin-antitoxin system Phd/YefM family antitoxin [Candidatus Hydrogenedentota bacterium]
MRTVTITEFRKSASALLGLVKNGETLLILRHGRPIAKVSPVSTPNHAVPSWKRPSLKLVTKGSSLSAAILEERRYENIL